MSRSITIVEAPALVGAPRHVPVRARVVVQAHAPAGVVGVVLVPVVEHVTARVPLGAIMGAWDRVLADALPAVLAVVLDAQAHALEAVSIPVQVGVSVVDRGVRVAAEVHALAVVLDVEIIAPVAQTAQPDSDIRV